MLRRKLRSLRALSGLTQKQIAEKLGLSETSYTKRENGLIDFSVEEVKKMKEVFGLSDAEIVEIFFANEVAYKTTAE